MGLTKMMIRIGLIGSVLALSLSAALAVAQDYIPPPTGPYQSSVVINRMDRSTSDQDRIYRFPPADLVEPPPPIIEDEQATAEVRARQPITGSAQAGQAAQVPGSGSAGNYRQAYPSPQEYPSAAQWGYPYNYGSGWNTNPPAYPYPPAYPQQPYPYGYNQYDSTNNFFPGMPTPWTDNPMQQFFGQ